MKKAIPILLLTCFVVTVNAQLPINFIKVSDLANSGIDISAYPYRSIGVRFIGNNKLEDRVYKGAFGSVSHFIPTIKIHDSPKYPLFLFRKKGRVFNLNDYTFQTLLVNFYEPTIDILSCTIEADLKIEPSDLLFMSQLISTSNTNLLSTTSVGQMASFFNTVLANWTDESYHTTISFEATQWEELGILTEKEYDVFIVEPPRQRGVLTRRQIEVKTDSLKINVIDGLPEMYRNSEKYSEAPYFIVQYGRSNYLDPLRIRKIPSTFSRTNVKQQDTKELETNLNSVRVKLSADQQKLEDYLLGLIKMVGKYPHGISELGEMTNYFSDYEAPPIGYDSVLFRRFSGQIEKYKSIISGRSANYMSYYKTLNMYLSTNIVELANENTFLQQLGRVSNVLEVLSNDSRALTHPIYTRSIQKKNSDEAYIIDNHMNFSLLNLENDLSFETSNFKIDSLISIYQGCGSCVDSLKRTSNLIVSQSLEASARIEIKDLILQIDSIVKNSTSKELIIRNNISSIDRELNIAIDTIRISILNSKKSKLLRYNGELLQVKNEFLELRNELRSFLSDEKITTFGDHSQNLSSTLSTLSMSVSPVYSLIENEFENSLFIRELTNRSSPLHIDDSTSQYLGIKYSRPSLSGRSELNLMTPDDYMPWRTGANEATVLKVKQPLKLGDQTIEPGIYSLFTIVDQNSDNWGIILNKRFKVWGTEGYNRNYDVIRYPVRKLETTNDQEIMKIELKDDIETQSVICTITWGKTSIPIKFIASQ